MMKYRDIEYTVVQGIGRDLWKWSASVADVAITGQAHSKSAAVVEAEKAIDRALALKKVRLVPPKGKRICLSRLLFTPEGQAAIEGLMLAAELGGPTMFARIGVMRALNRRVERVFDSSRKDKHWGRRKLARDQ
jgi:hypothetical protein